MGKYPQFSYTNIKNGIPFYREWTVERVRQSGLVILDFFCMICPESVLFSPFRSVFGTFYKIVPRPGILMIPKAFWRSTIGFVRGVNYHDPTLLQNIATGTISCYQNIKL